MNPSTLIDITLLKENPDNPRTITDQKFQALVKSIKDFPRMLEVRPIAFKTGFVVLGGNMRLRACKEAGLTKVPAIDCSDMSEEQQREFIIKDNVGFGEWNWEQIIAEWPEAPEWGLDIPDKFQVQLEASEDDYEIPDEIETDIVLGDLFEIGEHRLMCGSCTESDAVGKLLNGKEPYLMVTDPPYGVKYVGKTKDALTIENDSMSEKETHQLWSDCINTIWTYLKDGCVIYATVPAGPLHLGFAKVLKDYEALRQIMIWNKGSMVMGRGDYHYKHEPILYGWKPGAAHYFTKDRTKTTVFDYAKPSRNTDHPTMKPVELWSEFISNSSKTKDVVYDPFLGSGTTMVASHQLNRKCYGMELDPKYCEVIVQRMRKLDPTLIIKKNGVALYP